MRLDGPTFVGPGWVVGRPHIRMSAMGIETVNTLYPSGTLVESLLFNHIAVALVLEVSRKV